MTFRDLVSKLRDVKVGDAIMPEDKNEINDALRELARALDVRDGRLVLKDFPTFENLRCYVCGRGFERGSLILFMLSDEGLVPVHAECVRNSGEGVAVGHVNKLEEKVIDGLKVKDVVEIEGKRLIKGEIVVEENGLLRIRNAELKFFDCGITCKGSLEISNSSLINLTNILLDNADANIFDTTLKRGLGRKGKEINDVIGEDEYQGEVFFLGGAVFSHRSKLYMVNVVVEDCSADYGGGVCCIYSRANAVNCRFSNCHASEDGGAMFIDSKSSVVLTNCTFENCSADWGGALAFGDADGTLVDCVFERCRASIYGDSIYIGDGDVRAVRCRFNGCKVYEYSGYFHSGHFNPIDCEGLD